MTTDVKSSTRRPLQWTTDWRVCFLLSSGAPSAAPHFISLRPGYVERKLFSGDCHGFAAEKTVFAIVVSSFQPVKDAGRLVKRPRQSEVGTAGVIKKRR